MYCNTSHVTLTNIVCKVKSVSRVTQKLRIGGEFIKDINKVYVRIKSDQRVHNQSLKYLQVEGHFYFKSFRNWRLVYKTEVIEVCNFFKKREAIPVLNMVFDYLVASYPTIPKSCPFKPRADYLNVSLTFGDEGGYIVNGKRFNLPNGMFKYTLRGFTDRDPVGAYAEFIVEINRRFNDDQF
jgi:Protein of unknown function (DUF1091)